MSHEWAVPPPRRCGWRGGCAVAGLGLGAGLRIACEQDARHPVAAGLKMIRDGISSLAPGKEIRTLFDTAIKREGSGLPDAYEVVISYADEKGRRRFEETLDLDIGLYRDLGSLVRYDVHDVKKSLDKIRKEMHRWTAGTRGLLTLSPEERRAENERQMRELEEQ